VKFVIAGAAEPGAFGLDALNRFGRSVEGAAIEEKGFKASLVGDFCVDVACDGSVDAVDGGANDGKLDWGLLNRLLELLVSG
jgi:hypothetical protein